MGRKSLIDDRQVYAALGRTLAERGQATLADVQAATGVSTGSLYHRYGSREGMMAEAWLTTVSLFQERFLAALLRGSAASGVEAALETPRFCRADPDLSLVLVCCRPSEFLSGDIPSEVKSRVRTANTQASRAIEAFAKRIDRPLLACRLALIAFPLGAVRLFLPQRQIPMEVDDHIRLAVEATLKLSRPAHGG